MTAPNLSQPANWYPAANPGSSHRQRLRYALADWITAQKIPLLMHIYRSVPGTGNWRFDDFPGDSGARFAALCAPRIATDSESRKAKTGPLSVGGKMITFACELQVVHRTYFLDDTQNVPDSEDDYDRVIDALKDCLRGPSRDLGRPDVYLTMGEWPQEGSIRTRHLDAVLIGDSSVERAGYINFNVEQYLTDYPEV